MKTIKLVCDKGYKKHMKLINEVVYPMTEFDEVFVKIETKEKNFLTTYICRRDEKNKLHVFLIDAFTAED